MESKPKKGKGKPLEEEEEKPKKEYPYAMLEQFFFDYAYAEIMKHFEQIIDTCVRAEEGAYTAPRAKGDLIYLIRQLEKLLEAWYLITETRKPH